MFQLDYWTQWKGRKKLGDKNGKLCVWLYEWTMLVSCLLFLFYFTDMFSRWKSKRKKTKWQKATRHAGAERESQGTIKQRRWVVESSESSARRTFLQIAACVCVFSCELKRIFLCMYVCPWMPQFHKFYSSSGWLMRENKCCAPWASDVSLEKIPDTGITRQTNSSTRLNSTQEKKSSGCGQDRDDRTQQSIVVHDYKRDFFSLSLVL